MRHILTLILGLVLITGCTNGTGQEEKQELVPNSEKYVHDGDSEQPDSLRPEFKPDTTIGQISLINSKKVDSFLGENVMVRLLDKGIPSSSVISSNSKQRLTFYFHPGSVAKEFSEFKISYVDQTGRKEFTTKEKEFKTESGIKLGITMGELRSIKGEPDSLTKNESTVFHYKIDNFENSKFLKRYNMPIYYADYEFKDGYLTEFKFGFEYP